MQILNILLGKNWSMNSHEEEIKRLNGVLEILSRQVKMLEERYRAITETVVDAIISIDEEGHIIICNPATKKIFGYEDEIIGSNITTLMPERFRNAHQSGMNRYLNTGIPRIIGRTVEVVGMKKDGIEFPIELSLSTWRTDERCYFTGIIRDITERKQMEHILIEDNKKLEELSIRDSLTNVYNRRYAYQVLESEFNRSKRYKTPLSCLLIDADHFKKINDQYGHPFGDKVLVNFASLLQKMARTTDIVSRFGGEEFLVILPDIDMKGAAGFAERLRETISKQKIECKEENICVVLTISIGACSFTENTANITELLHQADIALYEAKRLGRNRVCCYKPPLK